MPQIDAYENGTPCWADIGTPDVAAAATFYGELLGWDVEIGPAEMGHYSMAMVKGQPVAALADQQQPGMVFWATYFAVDSVDETVAKATTAGGTVLLEPMDVMTFGRMAVLADPAGAPLSLWQAGDHQGAGLTGEPGTLCWHELTTRAVDESIAFLGATFGLTAKKIDMSGTDYYELQLPNGTTVAGLMPMVGDMWPPEIPNHWMIYFAVDDADATAARCTDLGGAVPVPPTDIPPGRFAVLNDPQGGHFSIIQPAPA